MHSIVRTNLFMCVLKYFIVSSLRMTTSRNMQQSDKEKYMLVKYVNWLLKEIVIIHNARRE